MRNKRAEEEMTHSDRAQISFAIAILAGAIGIASIGCYWIAGAIENCLQILKPCLIVGVIGVVVGYYYESKAEREAEETDYSRKR